MQRIPKSPSARKERVRKKIFPLRSLPENGPAPMNRSQQGGRYTESPYQLKKERGGVITKGKKREKRAHQRQPGRNEEDADGLLPSRNASGT